MPPSCEQSVSAHLRKPRLPQTEVLDELIRADALPVGQKLVSLPVGEHDQNLRRADTAGDRAEHLRAFRMFLDVGQRPGASEQIQRQVGLRAILRPGTSASDFAVPAIEVHSKLTSGHTAVPDGAMLHELACTVDVELVFPTAVAAERNRIPDIGIEVAMVHRDGDDDFINPVVLHRDLCFDVDPRISGIVQVLADFPGEPPVLRHVVRLRRVRRHAPENTLIAYVKLCISDLM